MSTHVLAEDSLDNTLYGIDIGGGEWLRKRYCGTYNFESGVWQDGNLVRPNGANQAQEHGHYRRAKLLFGYLYKHIANQKLQELIYVQAYGSGREAYLILNETCSHDTDLEIAALNQAVTNSNIKDDDGVTSKPIKESSSATSESKCNSSADYAR